ncbi:HAD-IA family hydrolase [Citreimonas sp.]|uniref:HAD-IA family hydrolase n=1 Tax=Citreimonas sp. TaxID=3036715 RepID=UPI0035C7C8EB
MTGGADRLKLVIFDVDGTLVDSQADILESMATAFSAIGREAPSRGAVLEIVGLSLPQAMGRLVPDATETEHARLVETYKDRYAELRRTGTPGNSPLYPGMSGLVQALNASDSVLLGIATGKSRRGLDALLGSLDLGRFFVTTQVADDHPSKPHPSMVLAALAEAGVEPGDAVMVGDTSFDIEMAQAAGVRAIGVAWGYHDATRLTGADRVVSDALALGGAITDMLEIAP